MPSRTTTRRRTAAAPDPPSAFDPAWVAIGRLADQFAAADDRGRRETVAAFARRCPGARPRVAEELAARIGDGPADPAALFALGGRAVMGAYTAFIRADAQVQGRLPRAVARVAPARPIADRLAWLADLPFWCRCAAGDGVIELVRAADTAVRRCLEVGGIPA